MSSPGHRRVALAFLVRASQLRSPLKWQQKAGRAAMEQGLRRAEVHVKGPGSGRDTALRSIQQLGIEVSGIKDVSPIPHNGCLQPKRKRP